MRDSTPGIITDDSEKFCLNNREFEIAGWTCGAADRGGVSKKVKQSRYRPGVAQRVLGS